MRVEFEGTTHEFPDDASEAEIQAILGGGGAAPAEPSQIGAYGAAYARQMGLAARDQVGGLAKGVASLGTLPVDLAVNAGYGAQKLLAKTGAVSQPNPDFYYGKGKGFFPATEGISDAVDQGLDATGLPKPEEGTESMLSTVRQGATSALGPAGLGRLVKGGVGAFLAAEPGVQAASGAASGAAAGALEANPEIGRKLDEYVPGASIAAPLVAGLGAGTAITATRAFGGHVPGFGSTRTGSTGMRDALANEVVQGIADDPRQAAANLRARTRFEESSDFVAPGYSELSTNAAGDTGLAAGRQALGDMAGGALAERMQGNNAALTRAFRREGADDLSGDMARQQAGDLARQDLPRFGLTADGIANNPDPVNVTPFMQSLRRDMDPRQPGTSASSRAAAAEIRGNLSAVGEYQPVPAAGAGMGPRNDFMAIPERLQAVRNDVSEGLAPARPGATPAMPSVANARGYAGRQLGTIDEILGQNTPAIPGPGGTDLTHAEYMARQRGLRQEGNERSFMAALQERLAPNTNAVTGAREFKPAEMARLGNMRVQERSVPGGGNLSIERLRPARQEFLDRIQNIGEVANFGNSAGTASRGASTARTATTAGQIGNTIKANAAPYEKLLDFAGRNGLTMLGRFGAPGQLATGALRGVGRLYQMGAQDGIPDAATAVRGRIGRFETDRPAAIEMLTGRTTPERGVMVSAKRQIGREAKFGAQGLLASQLDAREKRQRRRPFGG